MKRFSAAITVITALAMTSCMKEFSPDAGLAGGFPHILSINAEFAPFEGDCEVPESAAKGAITPSMYDTISVFGYSYTTEIGKANICCNETMTGDGSTFSPEEEVLLPESEGNIYLWGIAPVNANGVTLPASTASGTPSFTYSMPMQNSEMQDIVVGTSGPHSSLTGVPEMMFKHIMSAVRIDLSKVNEAFSISEVKLTNLYTTARYTPGSGWSGYADKQDRSMYITANISESDNGQTLIGGENLFIIPPGAINSDTELIIVTDAGEYSCSLSNMSLTAGQVKIIGIELGEQCIDLSMIDFLSGEDIACSTANCYIVKEPGCYKFPLVYGNALDGGAENPSSYSNGSTSTMKAFCDHTGAAITSPYILTQTGFEENTCRARTLWSTKDNMISDVKVQEGYIQFTVNSLEGNALIAFIHDGTVLWSWHIWATGLTFSRASEGFLSHNIGATEGNPGGCFFQWGRKDPFITGEFTCSSQSVTDMSGTITAPDSFITGLWSYGCSHRNNWDADNDLLSTDSPVIKTIYDPCPAGFHVPGYNAFIDCTFENGNPDDSGFVWFGLEFPFTGYIDNQKGQCLADTANGECWLASPSSASEACFLGYGNNSFIGVKTQFNNSRTMGYPVRPTV